MSKRLIGYTPGPWKADDYFISTDEEDPQTVAYASNHRNRKQRSKEEEQANAYLIAAAPDLLEAAKKLVCRLESLGVDEKEFTDLKKAISKALEVE